MFVIVSVLRDL